MRLQVKPLTEEQKEEARLQGAKEMMNTWDSALGNSLLSSLIYHKNDKAFRFWQKDSRERRAEGDFSLEGSIYGKKNELFDEGKLLERTTISACASKFEPVDLDIASHTEKGPGKNKFFYKSEAYAFEADVEYKDGIYRANNNLAGATAVLSRNSDGTKTLHLAFRGTDNEAAKFSRFLKSAYSDMEAYYDTFKPFEKAALEYAADPKNRISKIDVTGHSLGGAMVQNFFASGDVKRFDDAMRESGKPVELQGFTFGAPPGLGRNNIISAMFPAMVQTVKDISLAKIVNLEFVADFGRHYDIRKRTSEMVKPDNRIIEYQHSKDLINIAGKGLLRAKTGDIVTLKDRSVNDREMEFILTNDDIYVPKKDGPKNPLAAFGSLVVSVGKFFKDVYHEAKRLLPGSAYHDMSRYILNTQAEINHQKQQNPDVVMMMKKSLPEAVLPFSRSLGSSFQAFHLKSLAYMKRIGADVDVAEMVDVGAKDGLVGVLKLNKEFILEAKKRSNAPDLKTPWADEVKEPMLGKMRLT